MAAPARGTRAAHRGATLSSSTPRTPAPSDTGSQPSIDAGSSTTAGSAPKRLKTNGSFRADQEIVTVSVEQGDYVRQFKVPKYFLVNSSSKFREFFDDNEENKVMILHDTSSEQFEIFLNWLYTKDLVVEEMNLEDDDHEADRDSGEDSNEQSGDGSDGELEQASHEEVQRNKLSDDAQRNGNAANDEIDEGSASLNGFETKPSYDGVNRYNRVFARLVNLYIFADKHAASQFKTIVMLHFQRYVYHTEVLPSPTIVRHALDNLDFDNSGMCDYLIQRYAYYTDFKSVNEAHFASLTPQFLAAVLATTFERLKQHSVYPVTWRLDDWCKYHEHEDERSRRECFQSRPEDLDIRRQAPLIPSRAARKSAPSYASGSAPVVRP